MLVEAGSSQIPQSVVIHGARALEIEYPAPFICLLRSSVSTDIVIFGAGGLSWNVWILLTCCEDVDEDKAGVAGVCAYV